MIELYGIINGGLWLSNKGLNPPCWTLPYWNPAYAASKAKATRHLRDIRRIYKRSGISLEDMRIYFFTEEDTFRILQGKI